MRRMEKERRKFRSFLFGASFVLYHKFVSDSGVFHELFGFSPNFIVWNWYGMGEVSQFLGEGLLIFGVMPHDNTVNERDIGYIELTYHFIFRMNPK